ncbi:MerR family transcriptional regulator [Leuconostoc litchii]|uniref:MerR family transcriptional regulator n=1 Tax=Leuconostoc litchii TaxID=1981069 RepID=A0A6P2CKG8_9LACO|nr:MerR family transcriptional regulator [Leuconostoc litchii]TYC46219.1 MerR family transcriptional regulator [Leuconostoc litchii]GMA69922.1 MerR family transcriptional regulator [Leuconostoc litchii]
MDSCTPNFNFKKPAIEKLQFGIGDLAKMTDVSTRQLRYWEKQGYVKAIERDDNQESRLYGFRAFVKVSIIKQHINDGDTLHTAVERANKQLDSAMITQHIMKKAFQGLEDFDGSVAVNLGYFDDAETQLLYVFMADGKVKYRVVDIKK